MDKDGCKLRLRQVRANFVFGFAALEAILKDPQSDVLKHGIITLRDKNTGNIQIIDVRDTIPIINKSSGGDKNVNEFAKMLLRMFVLDCFEIIKNYCAKSGQKTLLEAQRWYKFAFIMRNCFGHNNEFTF